MDPLSERRFILEKIRQYINSGDRLLWFRSRFYKEVETIGDWIKENMPEAKIARLSSSVDINHMTETLYEHIEREGLPDICFLQAIKDYDRTNVEKFVESVVMGEVSCNKNGEDMKFYTPNVLVVVVSREIPESSTEEWITWKRDEDTKWKKLTILSEVIDRLTLEEVERLSRMIYLYAEAKSTE